MVDGIYHHYDDISAQNAKRRRPRQDRSASEHLALGIRRRSIIEPQFSGVDSLWYARLPDKIKKRQFSREEQVALAKHLRRSVILDAADEAICKIGRRASRTFVPDHDRVAPTHSRSMTSYEAPSRDDALTGTTKAPESVYDSFRWLDEEDDLDLRLFLDDYHANLRDTLPEPAQAQRPSFRRHLSISKIPFSRPSLSSRPGTKDAMSSPMSPPLPTHGTTPSIGTHVRRRSRALSLITTKHARSESVTMIDPEAAHYQDPEARLKLRVYLASPQKFDEAIEFGFPSADVLAGAPAARGSVQEPKKRKSRQEIADFSEHLRTFLADEDEDEDEDENDKMSTSDQASIAEPESPKTPHAFERLPAKPFLVPGDRYNAPPVRPSETYAQGPAASREMTLRMTLTRPDLRANEDQIYGWQQKRTFQHTSRPTQGLREGGQHTGPLYLGDASSTERVEKILAGTDHWSPDMSDRGVMKRIWNRVRRS